MDVILFVAWDTAGEEYGIPLSVVADKSDKILDFIQLVRMFWEAPSVTMLPCGQSWSQEASFKIHEAIFYCGMVLLLYYVLTMCCVLSYYLFPATSGIWLGKSSLPHDKKPSRIFAEVWIGVWV